MRETYYWPKKEEYQERGVPRKRSSVCLVSSSMPSICAIQILGIFTNGITLTCPGSRREAQTRSYGLLTGMVFLFVWLPWVCLGCKGRKLRQVGALESFLKAILACNHPLCITVSTCKLLPGSSMQAAAPNACLQP
eukprot:1137367-Pelagomonas_calceolata.AAC.3